MKIAITGATGFIGRRLVRRILDEGKEGVLVFSRNAESARSRFAPEVEVVPWKPEEGPPAREALAGIGAVINLAGEPVAQRWNSAVKQRIRDSRILTTKNLVTGILSSGEGERPGVLISGSAVGYYGARGDEILDEEAPAGDDFLSGLCREWEAEALRASSSGLRVLEARIGIVLGPRGGVLSRMIPFYKLFLGGPLGDGHQWMSWIHIDDAVGILLHALRHETLAGPMNITAPAPVTNLEFARTLGRVLNRPAALPTPPSALRLFLGEFADMLLNGQRAVPRKAESSGYRFRFPELEPAIRDNIQS